MNICREYPIKLALRCIAVLAVVGAIALAQDAPKKITHAEALSALATKVQPEYPPIAKQLKVQGTVELLVVVAETGEVAKVDILSGNALLTNSSVQAVKHWKFRPFTEDAKAIRVQAPVTLDFKL